MTAGATLTAAQRATLGEMGIEVWVRRNQPAGPPDEPAPGGLPAAWEPLRAAVSGCTACALHRTRTRTVFGVGSPSARWMLIGEAPGAEEDAQGEPFVGAAGKLLNEMLRAVGLERGDVFIANVIKCRPPENRNPLPDEIAACAGHLQAQIRLIAPKLILAIGRVAAQSLLGETAPIGRLRGRVHAFGPAAIPLVATYHPAYLLRSPLEKRKVWDDLRFALGVVDPRAS
jgi:DNA polymerase